MASDNKCVGGNLYAVLCLAPLVITVALIALFPGPPPSGQRIYRITLFILPLLGLLVFPVSYAGSPTAPGVAWLCLLCIPFCVLFIKRLWIAVTISVLFFIQGFSGQWLYEMALRSSGVTDADPKYVAQVAGRNLKRVLADVGSVGESGKKYSPAYLDEINDANVQLVLQNDRYGNYVPGGGSGPFPIMDYRIEPYWHTRLTGLWHMQTRMTKIWFDGGRLDNPAAFHVEGIGSYVDGETYRVRRA